MNSKQFKLMWVVIIAFVFVLAFPPVDDVRADGANYGFFCLKFIFDGLLFDTEVNWAIWIVELIVLAVVSVGLWFTFSDKRQK